MLGGMARRVALFLMPSFAVLATAALVLGPGRERAAVGVRVWGVPAEGATVAAWRLETLEREFGADRALAVATMDLSVSQGGRRIAGWSGPSGDDGVAEAVVRAEEPLAGTLDVTVIRGRTALAAGSIALRPAPPATFERRVAQGTARGPIALRVEVARGVLAAPFVGVLHVVATRDGAPAAGIQVKVALAGADTAPGQRRELTTDSKGHAEIHVVPQQHSVELKLEATDPRAAAPPPGAATSTAAAPTSTAAPLTGTTAPSTNVAAPLTGTTATPAPAASAVAAPSTPPPPSTWGGDLPVRPGAIWLGPARPVAEIVSPVPRERVYLSALGERGRVFGEVVPLRKTASGLFEGTFDLRNLAGLGAVALTTSGDPQEQGPGTVTWALEGAATSALAVTAAPHPELLLDGVPFAERLEKKRAGTARLASVAVAFAAALFEAVLLVLYSRAAQAQLAAHLARAAEDDGDRAAASRMVASPASRAISLVVAVGLIVLAFGAVAAFSIVR